MKKLLLVSLTVGFYAFALAQTETPPGGNPDSMGTGTTTNPSGTLEQQREESVDHSTIGGESNQQRMQRDTDETNHEAIDETTIESDSMDMDPDRETMDSTTNP